MPPIPHDPQGLHALLWASQSIFAARVDDAGRIVAANAALERAGGRPLAGEPVTVIVAEPQRPALAAFVEEATDHWTALTVGLWHGGPATAQDRILHARRAGAEVLLVAEPEDAERDRLVEQVLRLNDDLIAGHRELGRRQREIARAQAGAEEAHDRLRRLEAVVLTGFMSGTTDQALRRLLVLARDALGAERAAALLVEDDGRSLRVRAAINMDIVGDVTPFGTGVSGVIAESGLGQVFDDVAVVEGSPRSTGASADLWRASRCGSTGRSSVCCT